MSVSQHILIVEDDPEIAKVLALYMTQAGFTSDHLDNGLAAIERVRQAPPNLMLLDLNIKGADGLKVCREVRGFSTMPIIMVTGRVEEIDRLLGLEWGADDYICKPFSPREVVARVNTVLRRAGTPPPSAVKSIGMEIDDEAQRVLFGGRRVELTPTEFRLFSLLAARPGRIYDRAQILDLAFPDGHDVSDRVIDSHIKNIRRKIAAVLPGVEVVHSVYGIGYRFEI